VDKTGRPGPSTWKLGNFPDGADNHPVAGVSWFEAAAFAKFAKKQLPTLFHWFWAAFPPASPVMLPRSNFHGRGTAPVGTHDGISPSGLFDAAGNVREWMWNRHKNDRYLLGGGWSDPEYMFTDANAQSPFDRSGNNGFRLMKPLQDKGPEFAFAPVDRADRDYRSEQPVPDEIFEVFRRLYAYDRTDLNPELLARESVEHWTREQIEIDAAYGDERLTVYLFLPNGSAPPHRPIVYFPGAGAIYRREYPPPDEFLFPFLIKSGYAVLFPVYKGTWERGTEDLKSDVQNETNAYREYVVKWSKDLGRALDYLETRTDMLMPELGFFSLSWGSAMAPVMLALEPRIKAGVLVSGGLVLQPTQPEVDPFNFLPRVTVPTLMINIPNDFFYPLEKSQKPFYEFLGAAQKDHVLIRGGHVPPMNPVARETLNWFDKHLHKSP
jgi:dienelactone hydrolase